MVKQYVGKNTIRQFIKNTKAGLSTKVKMSDIVDNVTTSDDRKLLSANQGKLLMDKIATLDSNNDGIADNAAMLGGHTPDYFATAESVQEQVTDQKGQPDGLAPLGPNGKIDSEYLPSYVDDVIEGYLSDGVFYEDEGKTTEITGEKGKIYIDLITNQSYRWSGTEYIEITSPDMVEIEYDYIRSIYDSITADKMYNGPTRINDTADLSDESTLRVTMDPIQYITTNCNDIINTKVVGMKVIEGIGSASIPTLEGNEYIMTVKNSAVVGNIISVEFTVSSDNYKNIKIKYRIEITRSTIDIATLGITDATTNRVYDGTVQKPTIDTGEHNLVEGTDYEIEMITDGIYAGTQRYKVKGIGKYDGEIELTFSIERKLVGLSRVILDDTVIDSNKNPSITTIGLVAIIPFHDLSTAFKNIPSTYSNVIGEYFTFPEESGVYSYLIAKKTFTVDEMLISFKNAGLEMIPSMDDLRSYIGRNYPEGSQIPSDTYTFSKFATVDWDIEKMPITGFVYNVEDIPYDGNPHNFDDVELIQSFSYSGTNKFVQNGKVTGLKKGIDYTIGRIYQDATKVDNAILPGSYRKYYTLNFGPKYNSSVLFNITKGTHADVALSTSETLIDNWPESYNMTMKIFAVSSLLGLEKGSFTLDTRHVSGPTFIGDPGKIVYNVQNSFVYNSSTDLLTYVLSDDNKSEHDFNYTLSIPVKTDLYEDFNATILIKLVN